VKHNNCGLATVASTQSCANWQRDVDAASVVNADINIDTDNAAVIVADAVATVATVPISRNGVAATAAAALLSN
jgi:hypothetical protein